MSDPAAGKFELPGGHREGDETARAAAVREFQEETGLPFPDGEWTGTWTSSNGIYQGFVLTIPREADLDIFARQIGSDPDGDVDGSETIAWWDPADLPGNPAVRAELLADMPAVMAALGCTPGCCGADCCQDGGCCGGSGGCTCGTAAEVAKASPPKALEPPRPGPVWAEVYDRRRRLLTRHQKAVAAAWDACVAEIGSPRDAVRQFRSETQMVAKLAGSGRPGWKDAGTAAALAWLERIRDTKGYPALVAVLESAIADGMAEGEADALALAASKQHVKGFSLAAAFTAAALALQGDPDVSQRAQETADAIVNGAAADIGGTLAVQSDEGSSGQDMTSAAQDAASGSQSRSLGQWLKDAVWGAIAAGVAGLISRINSGTAAEGETEPGKPQGPDVIPPPDQPLMVAWITDGNPCKACQDCEAGSPYFPQDLPALPQHPHCQCDTAPFGDIPSSLFAAMLLD